MNKRNVALSLLLTTTLAGACTQSNALPTSPTATSSTPAAAPAPVTLIQGIVKEGSGVPLAGVTVSGPTVPTTTTDALGRFTLPFPVCEAPSVSTSVRFSKPGYVEVPPMFLDCKFSGTITLPMQPVLLMAPDAQLATTLYRGDADLYFGDFCSPCKLIAVHVNVLSAVTVHLHWSSTAALGLWVFTNQFGPAEFVHRPDKTLGDVVATVHMTPDVDARIYVGALEDTPFPADVAFDVTTSTTQ